VQDNLPQIAVQTLQFNYKIDTQANPDVGSGKLDGAGIPPDFFADIHVRRGFAYAFDYAANLSGAYAGKGVLPHGPIVQGLLGYDATVPVYTTNRDKAIAELKEASGGKVWDTGFKFTIPYTAGNTARQVGAQIVKETVGALNSKFQIDSRPVPSSTLIQLLLARKGTMYFLGWFADYPDPHDFAQPFLSANGYFPTRGGYRNPDADSLIDQAVGTADAAKRKALYKQLSMIAYNDLPYLFLVQPVRYYTMRSWVLGWYYNPIFPGQYFYTMSKR
jgi:peptide/nickel transport system substrate-binding protein